MPTRKPMKRATIRSLRADEPLPAGEPKRYKNPAGYVRLRWKVGPQQYVEVYEHRLVAGMPAGEVHHRDHSKDNNADANLAVLSKREHAERHAQEKAGQSRRETEWGGLRSRSAYDKSQRRLARLAERRAFLAQLAELHSTGKTTVEIGAIVGRNSSNVSRALRAAGVSPAGRARTDSGEVSMKVRSMVQARAEMRCEVCSVNLLWGGGQVHHRTPRGMGGSRVPERHQPQNLLFLCADCHRMIESRRADAIHCGWLVPSGTDPATIRARVRGELMWLTNQGTYVAVLGA